MVLEIELYEGKLTSILDVSSSENDFDMLVGSIRDHIMGQGAGPMVYRMDPKYSDEKQAVEEYRIPSNSTNVQLQFNWIDWLITVRLQGHYHKEEADLLREAFSGLEHRVQ